LEQLFDSLASVLAAVAGLAVAAERGERIEGAAVDLDLTRADALAMPTARSVSADQTPPARPYGGSGARVKFSLQLA
jgi:hypothetical protein